MSLGFDHARKIVDLGDWSSAGVPEFDLWLSSRRAAIASRSVDAAGEPSILARLLERITGSGLPRHLRNSDYLLIHIPKNAGISLADALYGKPVWPRMWHRTALQIKSEYPDFFSTRISFAIIRNPWDRVVSAYEYLRAGGTPRAPLARKTTPPSAKLRSFEIFVLEYLLPNKDRLHTLDEVLWEQTIFVDDGNGNCLVDFLARFEDLARLEDVLTRQKAIERPLTHLNRSSTRVGHDYRSYFTSPGLVDVVAACYARDAGWFLYNF